MAGPGIDLSGAGPAGGGTPVGVDSAAGQLVANQLTTGQETISRSEVTSNVVPLATSGTLRLTQFNARKSESSTQVRVLTGTTAAAATPTLIRFALYLVDANGDGTLVASTTNDTALLAVTNTANTKAWTTPYAVVAGLRYAFGILVVSAAAMPTFQGSLPFQGTAGELLMEPKMSGMIAGQANLPASFLSASLTASGSRIYAAILP